MAQDYGTGGPISVSMDGPFGGSGTTAKLTNISFPTASWKGGESPYYQVVKVEGVSVNSIVNLNPSADEMERFHNQHIEFTAKNDGGIVTLYAIGDRPAADGVFQATISDVVNLGESDGAVIWGNTVCTPMVRTNWEQKDPTKADYLKGRDALEMLIQNAQTAGDNAQTTADNAQTAADNAQTTADNAQTAADNAQTTADNAQSAADDSVKKSGDTMTGALHIPTPTESSHAANKQYVDEKVKLFICVLTVNDWVGDKAPYKQTIGIEGILGTDRPHYGPVYSESTETALAEREAFAMIDDLDTAAGSVTFTCFEDKPEVNLTIQMEVHR